jgi:hypothetical protein
MTGFTQGSARRVVSSLVSVICPPDAIELGLRGEITAHVELSIAALSPPARHAMHAGMVVYDQSARLWPPARGRRAADLPEPLARQYFEMWWRSRVPPRKNFAMGLKALICLACYEMPAMKKRIGYTPEEWIARVKAARLSTHKLYLVKRERELLEREPLGPFKDKAAS